MGYSVLQTLNSIKAQTFNNYEVILVNDGSTDNTQKILDSFQIAQKKTIVTQSNNGLGAARNSGIKICEGEYIALLDADDIWKSQKLEKVYAFLMRNDCDVVCHNEYVTTNNNEILKNNHYGPYTRFNDLFFKNNCLSPSAVTIKKSTVQRIGYFTEDLHLHGVEDYDLWLRLALAKSNIKYMSDFLGSYVIHGNNMSTEYNFFDKIEYLHILYFEQINKNNIKNVVKYKFKLLKIYYSKTIIAVLSKKYKDIFMITKDIVMLFFFIDYFILKKQKELGK